MPNYQVHTELFHNSADGMFIFEDLAFVDANNAALEMFGYTHDKLASLHPGDISPPLQPDGTPSSEKANEFLQVVMEKGSHRFQWVHQKSDGTTFWAEVSLTKVRLDDRTVIYALVRDIDKEKRDQDELLRTKAQLQDIITNFPVAIVRAETDNVNVGYFNRRFHELFGWKLEDISTMEKWFAKAYPDPDYRQRIMQEWGELIHETHEAGLSTSPRSMEAHVHCSDGTVKICQAWYYWNQGNTFGIFHDITAQREAENKLQEINADLDLRIKEAIEQQRQQEQILLQQSKMAAMGEMIGAIAHQWRQPLNIMGLEVQDLLDAYNYGELDENYLEGTVKRSMEVINYMSQTIDDFRNFFHPNKSPVTFDTIQTMDEAVKIVEAQFKYTHIEIRREYSCTENCLLYGYPSEFKQLVLNLLNNAKDAITEWKSQHPDAPSGLITIRINEQAGKIQVEIEDNGGGIPETLMEKIFEPYFTTKEKTQGTGLGLYMSKIILDKHMGGTIHVTNASQGACFRLLLDKHPVL